MKILRNIIRKILSESYLKEDDDPDWELYEMMNDIKLNMLHDFSEKVEVHKKKYDCTYVDPIEQGREHPNQLSIFDKDEYLTKDEEKLEPYWDCGDAENDSNFKYCFEGRQPWNLIPLQTLKNVWMRFATTAPGLDIPPATIKTLNKIINIMINNIIKIDVNTEMTGHKNYPPEPSDYENLDLTKKDIEMWWGDYCEDGMEGQMRISDFALDKLMEKIEELRSEDDPHRRLQIADALLEIVHMRSDIAGWFVKGGSRALSDLSGYDRQQVAEVRKLIRNLLL